MLIGLADTFGKVLVPQAAGVTVYLLMAAILLWRPEGLFKRSGDAHAARRASAMNGRSITIGVTLVALALFPFAGATFYTELVTKVMILAIFALSLDLLVGYTGLVSFGHAAFFGIGAYTLGLMTPKYEAASLWLTLPAAMLAAGLAAFVVGLFVVRVKGVYFIMVTLAFAQMFYFVFHDTKFGRGSDGISMNFKPVATIGAYTPFDLGERDARLFFRVRADAGRLRVPARVLRSPFGCALMGIRSNEHRMRSLGFPVYRYKLASFTLAGTLAGLAGYLSALAVRFRQSGAPVVAPVGQCPADADTGRRGKPLRCGGRRLRVRCACGDLPGVDHALAAPARCRDHPAGDLPSGWIGQRRPTPAPHARRRA